MITAQKKRCANISNLQLLSKGPLPLNELCATLSLTEQVATSFNVFIITEIALEYNVFIVLLVHFWDISSI